MSKTKLSLSVIAALVIILALAGLYIWWEYYRAPPLIGFASGNGRLEATEVDIATKFFGRVSEILVDEGDKVDSGQVVARMDTESLEAQLREAKASEIRAEKQRSAALAVVTQRESECQLAKRDLLRSKKLYENGIISLQKLDQDRAVYDVAKAMCDAAEADVANAEAAIQAAQAKTERLQIDINDSVLKTPISGRVQYRLAEPGEVLSAGGKVLTIIDLSNVYMTVFLPTEDAGILAIGADSRIVLDAAPGLAIPATASYVSSKAQFTPKEVETAKERQKLVFRVKVRIPPETVIKYESWIKPGLPGVAFLRLDPAAKWPENLEQYSGF
jgi:HlyD family secretion protein